MNPWRLFILKIFGSNISGIPFVHSTAKIRIPWHLTLRHRSCLGECAVAYSLGEIEINEGATIAQEAYLCTGTHAFEKPTMQLITKKIIIEKNVFVGARAMILPGVTIHKNAIVGAMAVISEDVGENDIVAGNPARKISVRTFLK